MDEAVPRRLQQELGLSAELQFVYKFQYQARYDETGSEHELCWVYVGRCDDQPQPNDNEIAAYRYVSVANLDAELAAPDNNFTPWCQLEWQALRGPYAEALSRLTP